MRIKLFEQVQAESEPGFGAANPKRRVNNVYLIALIVNSSPDRRSLWRLFPPLSRLQSAKLS